MTKRQTRSRWSSASAIAALLLLLGLASAADARQVRQIAWSDLKPSEATQATMLDTLTVAQQKDIWFIAWVRNMRAMKMMPADSGAIGDAAAATRELANIGLDVDELIELSEAKRRLRGRQRRQYSDELDGQTVRISGYVVPVKKNGMEVVEFLLVPSARVCSHVPPTPNQAIYVVTDKSFPYRSNLFRPTRVSIAGRLAVKKTNQSLYLVDGVTDIDIGYFVERAHVATPVK